MASSEPATATAGQNRQQPGASRLRWTVLAGLIVLSVAAAAAGINTAKGRDPRSADMVALQAKNLSASGQAVAMPSFADLVDNVRQAVVSVRAMAAPGPDAALDNGNLNPFEGTPFERFFRGHPRENDGAPPASRREVRYVLAQGSGFILSEDGYIVTNNHVVDRAVKVEVVMDDGAVIPVKVVGTDPATDLALLKIENRRDLPFVTLADAAPRVGEWVVAMGNPYGLGGTVTAGIVSAKGRDIGAGPFDSYIQIDAPVNRGNSGGPTFNMSGQVIGVNTAIFSPSGGSIGIAFDIPAPVVKAVASDLRLHGHVDRGWLGVEIQPVTPNIAESLGVKAAAGALVAGIQPATPAAKSGLAVGDVIAEVDGATITDGHDLARRIGLVHPGKTVKLTIRRRGRVETLAVKVEPIHQATDLRGSAP
jgi:serine protease Do